MLNQSKIPKCLLWLPVLALAVLFAGGQTVQAQTCMQDNYTAAGNNQDLVCEAKEVFIDEDGNGDKLIDVTIIDGCAFPGDTATVDIMASIHFNSDRFDVGVYSALDGGNALTGQCAVDILDPNNPVDLVDGPGSADVVGSTGSFDPMDNDDACGDADIFVGGGGNLDAFSFQTLTLTCVDDDEDGFLDFSTCFSWRVSGNDEICSGAADIFPGNVAKCFCETSNIEVPVPGQIIIKKVTDPDPDPTDTSFAFTLTGGENTSGNPLNEAFSLKNGEMFDTASLGPDMAPLAGMYNAAETVPAGWELTSSTCDDGSPVNAIDLQAGETVTCTFTNTIQPGNIIVVKQTDPDGSTQSFNFTTDYNAGFSLTDGQSNDSGDLDPGTYSVSETAQAGWDLTSATCDDSSPVNAIDLAPGETVTCTFTNTIKRGKILVDKVTDPSGSSQSFGFTTNYGAGFNLTDAAAPNDSGDLLPTSESSTYSVSEGAVAGWDLTSATCSDGSPVNAIDLAPGETVTCTFNNKIQRGKILVDKVTDPSDSSQSFGFTTNYGAGFNLTDAAAPNDSGDLLPTSESTTYSVSEGAVAGWDLTSATCSDGSPVNAIDLAPGETVTCTFNNVQRGKIIVEKQTNPDNASGSFTFSGALAGTIEDDGTIESALITPGTYLVTELDPTPNFDLTAIICDDNASATASTWDVTTRMATFQLDPGETVKCTFTNTERGMVDLLKLTNGQQNQTMGWNFTLKGPAVDESDSSPPTTVVFGGVKLIPSEEYTLCETGIPAGWTLEWQADTDGDGVPDTIIPMVSGVNNDPVDPVTGYSRVYDPNYVAPPGTFTNDTRCVNFVVEPGETLAFQIDNQFPGGEPRTIGYWKNWNTCTGGNQPQTAANNGGPDEGWFILNDLLNDPGYTIGTLQLDGANCEDAVNILDKRNLSGKKKANDAAYNLAAQLLAAQLNLSAGAETCQAVVDAVNPGQALLVSINFDGTGSYLRPKDGQLYLDANALATTLDEYNNGNLCN